MIRSEATDDLFDEVDVVISSQFSVAQFQTLADHFGQRIFETISELLIVTL